MKNRNNLFGAIAILVGTCVGAGIFGLPYVISKVGVSVGIAYILVLGLITLITSLAYGEVVLSTQGVHQFPEYVKIYLGPRFKNIAVFTFAIGFYGALIAYLTETGNFLHALANPYLGGDVFYYRTAYFIFVSIAIYFGLGLISKLEKILVFVMLSIILLLLFFGIPHLNINNLLYTNLSNILLPYGVILFAVTGASAIPHMKSLLKEQKHKLKQAIVIGYMIPIIVYILVAFLIVGISGQKTTESAITGLGLELGHGVIIIGFIFGLITMTTSFLSLGLTLKDVYQFDIKINKFIAWLMVILPPFIIVSLNLFTFIQIIGLTGAIVGGIHGILIIEMYQKAKKLRQQKPDYELKMPFFFPAVILFIFTLGIIYEIYIALAKFS